MLKLLWLIFISLICSLAIVYSNFTFGWDYLSFFIKEQLVSSLLSVLGFNAASITFLISQLTNINGDFSSSKKEIFHNFIWMLIIFLLEFVLIVTYHFCDSKKDCLNSDIYNYVFFISIIALFLFFMYLFFEILHWIIFISSTTKKSQ